MVSISMLVEVYNLMKLPSTWHFLSFGTRDSCSALFSTYNLYRKVTFLILEKWLWTYAISMLCVQVSPPPQINCSMPEPNFTKVDMFIMVTDFISTGYSINPISLYVCMCIPLPVVKQRVEINYFRGNDYTCNNSIIVLCVILHAFRVA
jgi:hypothetical protein